jgi:glucose-1-phosphatase
VPKPDCILFDLGGVLVEWDGVVPLIEVTGGRLTPEQARLFWFESESVRCFETGRCTADEFARAAVKELGITLAPAVFLREFVSWDRGPLPGALDLLISLQPHFALACLSNNNPLHWNARKLQELAACFHRRYVSFEIGLMKPDPAAYQYVLADLEVEPAAILFFDDNPECVDAARCLGISAYVVKGPAAVQERLAQLGIP